MLSNSVRPEPCDLAQDRLQAAGPKSNGYAVISFDFSAARLRSGRTQSRDVP